MSNSLPRRPSSWALLPLLLALAWPASGQAPSTAPAPAPSKASGKKLPVRVEPAAAVAVRNIVGVVVLKGVHGGHCKVRWGESKAGLKYPNDKFGQECLKI